MLMADEVKQAMEQLETVNGTKLREAIQELNDYLAGREEVTNDVVKQAIEQLETVNGFETVNGTGQLREAEGVKRQPLLFLLGLLGLGGIGFGIGVPIGKAVKPLLNGQEISEAKKE